MTRAQRRAAQQNARKSTGPRTPEGKAASSRNAIRHNLAGNTFVLLPGEDRDAFQKLVREYLDEWKPVGQHESFLVTQMIQSRWRINRIARMEAECYDTLLKMPFADDQTDESALIIADRMMPAPNMLDKLHRYTRDAERCYHRAVREFHAHRKLHSENAPRQQQPVGARSAAASASSSFDSAGQVSRNEPNCASAAPSNGAAQPRFAPSQPPAAAQTRL